MTELPECPCTPLTLLFGSADPDSGLADAIGRVSADGGGLGRALTALPVATREAAGKEAAAAAATLLNFSLIDLLIMGWRKDEDLQSAARATLKEPGSSELVHLIAHRVNSSQSPQVTIMVAGLQVAVIRLDLSATFDVSPLLVRVRAGRVHAVLSGTCDATVALAIDDIDITSSTGHLDLPGEVALAHQRRLLPASDYPPDEEAHQPTATAIG
jgi:hypothetical protein